MRLGNRPSPIDPPCSSRVRGEVRQLKSLLPCLFCGPDRDRLARETPLDWTRVSMGAVGSREHRCHTRPWRTRSCRNPQVYPQDRRSSANRDADPSHLPGPRARESSASTRAPASPRLPSNSTPPSCQLDDDEHLHGERGRPSANGFDDDGRLKVDFFALSTPSVTLVMNSNNVEIRCSHDATHDVDHTATVTWVRRR